MVSNIRSGKIPSFELAVANQLGLTTVLAAILLVWFVVPAQADARSDAVWKLFRRDYPYHIQTVGLSDPSASGQRVLIISEPPPLMIRAQYATALGAVFGSALHGAELKKNPVGMDGWCEDVVATLAYPDTAAGRMQLAADMTRLATLLFGTTYKFAPMRLSDQAVAQSSGERPRMQAPLNLQISAAELDAWLLTPAQPVTALETGADYVVSDLLKDGPPGVYLSRQRGLVLLLLPRQEKLNAYRVAIREFALDTDAIVGALSIGDQRLAIVGRERDTPLAAVPPLRAETVLAMAATQQKQLGQSYERLAAFAGKLDSGEDEGRDWAPIYLSKDLFNSEFGSLLNFTDQMLKGWSQAGTVHYINFDYAPPVPYPFPDGVKQHLNVDELTYNWNTIGVGAIATIRDARIFTVYRTGSLPVSYCPGETCNADKDKTVVDAEEKAYNWFSGLRDSYLGRVVQYTSLYQIFREFSVLADRDEAPPENAGIASRTLTAEVQDALNDIISGKTETSVDHRLAEVNADSATLPSNVQNLFVKPMLEDLATTKKNVHQAATMLRNLRDQCDRNAVAIFASFIADRNTEHEDLRCRRSFSGNFRDLKRAVDWALPFAKDADKVRLAYMSAAKQIETGFIKTPSIVLSWVPGLVGGHNLYSRMTRIETTADVAAGQVRIDRSADQTILSINPGDAAHTADLARAYERSAGRGETDIQRILHKELASARPIRPQGEALALADSSPSGERGLTVKGEGDLTLGELGLRPTREPADLMARYQTEATQRKLDTLVVHDTDGYHIFRFQPRPTTSVRATTEPAMLEAVGRYSEQVAQLRGATGEPPVRIGFGNGFSKGEVHAIQISQEMRTAAAGGGGWEPPTPPRNSFGMSPEPGKQNGFFFEHEDSPGGGEAGYASRAAHGDTYSLRGRQPKVGFIREAASKHVNWDKAKIREIDQISVASDRAGLRQINFEIELPVIDAPFAERVGLFTRRPLLLRIISFFQREPAAAERARVNDVIMKTLTANAEAKAVTGDGMLALKAELLREIKPDALEFHVNYGSNDLVLVDDESLPAAAENVAG